MGYYTKFEIQVIAARNSYEMSFTDYLSTEQRAAKRLAAIDDTFSFYDDEDIKFLNFETLTEEPHKWEDSERVKSMTQLAKEFPGFGFLVYGDGEDPFDRWREFYLGDQHWHMEGHVTVEYDPLPYEVPSDYSYSCEE